MSDDPKFSNGSSNNHPPSAIKPLERPISGPRRHLTPTPLSIPKVSLYRE